VTDHEMSPEIAAQYAESQKRIAEARKAAGEGPATLSGRDAIAAMLSNFDVPEETPEQRAKREREAERREQRALEAQRQAIESRVREALYDVPITVPMLDAVIADSLGSTPAIDAVQRWIDAKGKPILVLLGGVGTGKTVAAAWALAREARRSPYHGASYAKIRDLANLFRAGFGEDLKAFERHQGARLLVVDELTTERDADLGRACLHELIDWRGAKGAPTILLANRTKAEIAKHYDARTIDRLRECAAVVELAGKSMRKGAW
jgi:DNA replication protein DnaC